MIETDFIDTYVAAKGPRAFRILGELEMRVDSNKVIPESKTGTRARSHDGLVVCLHAMTLQ